MMRKIERENTGLLQAGQDLVVAGYAGLAGTVKLAEAAKEELSRWFSDEYMEEIADAAPLCPVSPEFWRSCAACPYTGRKTYSGPGYRPGEQRHCTGNDRAGGTGLSGAPAAR